MKPRRRDAWKLLLTCTALIAVPAALVGLTALLAAGVFDALDWTWLPRGSGGHDVGVLLWAVLGATIVSAGLAAVLLARIWRDARRGWVRWVVRQVRGAGSLASPATARRDDDERELAPLGSALASLRRRNARQMDTIDHQRRMLEALVRQLRDGIILLPKDGRVRLVNPAAATLLGLPEPAEAYVGRPVHECVPLDVVRTLRLFPGRVPEEGIRQTKLRGTGKDGSRTLLAQVSPVELDDADGALRGRLVVLTDITELERTIQMRTDFVANASHELRTPLSTIRAATETLLAMDLVGEPDAAKKFLSAIERQSGRLEELVSDLLDLSSLESAQARFEPSVLKIADVLDGLRVRHAGSLHAKDMTIEFAIEPPTARTLHANEHLLRLVLDNLVDNAIKFSAAGATVWVSVTLADGTAMLVVRDNGCGIPAADQPRVFERFYQVSRGRSGLRRGTGLGLSIVRHAVSVMGGAVELCSTQGQGTTVTVRMPIGPIQPTDGQRRDRLQAEDPQRRPTTQANTR